MKFIIFCFGAALGIALCVVMPHLGAKPIGYEVYTKKLVEAQGSNAVMKAMICGNSELLQLGGSRAQEAIDKARSKVNATSD